MGLETAALVMATVSAAATAGKMVSETAAASEREKALDLQGKQLQLQTQQKTLQNYDVMEKLVDAQIAHMTTTGAAFSSPSFNAIERNTLNVGRKRAKNTAIEGEIEQENLESERRNVQNTLFAQLFGDVAEGAKSAASIYTSMPKKAS